MTGRRWFELQLGGIAIQRQQARPNVRVPNRTGGGGRLRRRGWFDPRRFAAVSDFYAVVVGRRRAVCRDADLTLSGAGHAMPHGIFEQGLHNPVWNWRLQQRGIHVIANGQPAAAPRALDRHEWLQSTDLVADRSEIHQQSFVRQRQGVFHRPDHRRCTLGRQRQLIGHGRQRVADEVGKQLCLAHAKLSVARVGPTELLFGQQRRAMSTSDA
jgi:hypothetical protein